MNLKLLLVLIALCLPACGTQPVKDDLPASDLLALKANAERDLKPRNLPNGKMYCIELAETEGEQDECAADLEDGKFLSEQDKARGLKGIITGIERLMLARNPCGFWAKLFGKDRCTVGKEK